ncbi:MAG: STAS domain-containing protein [Sphaerospermopsis sp. SIO1G2]|nr:STAS domain-containing protein [Sphaerospermopsis sp. SIO1G1]NET71970.1 STAS domain-containing protein [Sphaerospermopsis sp. SIO1G2]
MNIEQESYTNPEGDNIVIVLKPKERLDITTAWQFRLKLQECISKLSHHVIVNLEQVDFIDSSGLTSLVAGMRDADKVQGSFSICNVHPEAKLVFEVTMMDTVFEIFDTELEAVKAIFPKFVYEDSQSNGVDIHHNSDNNSSTESKTQSNHVLHSVADESTSAPS